jgi:hypothetical protein
MQGCRAMMMMVSTKMTSSNETISLIKMTICHVAIYFPCSRMHLFT